MSVVGKPASATGKNLFTYNNMSANHRPDPWLQRTFFSVHCPVCEESIPITSALGDEVICPRCRSIIAFRPKLRRELFLSGVLILFIALILFLNLSLFWASAISLIVAAIRMLRLKSIVSGVVIKQGE